MYLIAIGWIYVVLMMALAEALSPQGTVLGAFFTFVLYGVLPLAILLYILGTPARKRALKAAEAREAAAAVAAASSAPPDGGGHATGDAVAAERKEG
jgi:Na+/serine symporter